MGQEAHFSVSSLAPRNTIINEMSDSPYSDLLTINTVNVSDGVVPRDNRAASL